MYGLGVEIGGTKLQLALGTAHGAILETHRGRVNPEEGAAGILAWLEAEIPPFISKTITPENTPVAIGVGFGGPIETASGRVLVSHQVAGWQDIALKTWFEERFGLPTAIVNDANAAGWGEYCLGAGRGTSTFVYMNIGSGIGGALVAEGRLYDGQGRGGCEIGHMHVADWTAASPGATARLEDLCSGWSIEKRINADAAFQAFAPLDCPRLAELAREGFAPARDELRRIGRAVGQAMANVITVLHPQRIALGGGVALMGEVLLTPIREAVEELVFGPYKGRYEIVPCQLEEEVVIVGALLLAPYSGR